MKFRFALILLFCSYCSIATPLNGTSKKLEIIDSAALTGISQEVLFNRACMWVQETFKNSGMQITIQDKAGGIIFGEASIADMQAGYNATFNLSFKISDGKYLFSFNRFTTNAGNLDKSRPDCCVTDKKWRKMKAWANAKGRQMAKDLKERMDTQSPTEDYITIPLTGSHKETAGENKPGKNIQVHSQPVTWFIQAGGAYAPVAYGNTSESGGGRRGGFGGSASNQTAKPVTNMHAEFGLFIPGKLDNTRGFGINAGYLTFPLHISGSTPSYNFTSGILVNTPETTTTRVSYITIAPHYTLFSRKYIKFRFYANFGMDIFITSTTNMRDFVGPAIAAGYSYNGFALSATLDYPVNNIYGSTSGGFRQSSNLSVEPLFLGLSLGFYPMQNKWMKHVLGK